MFAANGDQLHLNIFGILTKPFPSGEGAGSYDITGGTGRFAGASGLGAFGSHGGMTLFNGSIRMLIGD